MSISTAVGLDRKSRVVGYQILKGSIQETSPNLPMRIAVLAQANISNQGTLDTTAKQITTATEAGKLYGYGSPIHQIVRILKPLDGDGVGGVPVIVYPQADAVASVAAERTITVTGTVTKNATHAVSINGRLNVDRQPYTYTVLTTDTPTTIAAKIADAINNVLGAPVSASSAAGVVTVTSKYAGIVSEQLDIEPVTDGNDVGLTYVVASTAVGAGLPDISGALNQFGQNWNTLVINSYDAAKFSDLEAVNGTPEDNPAGGRYSAIVFKPFVSFFGSKDSTVTAITTVTDAAARKSQVTNVLAPAPNSKGSTFEASANMCYLWALVGQNTPHLDISNKSYPDMPVPTDLNIGDFSNYDNRDVMAKKGASTVDIVGGRYTVMESLTTYHPDGEVVPQWTYVRSLIQDWNIRYGYYLLEKTFVMDHAIANDNQTVNVDTVIKPKQWIQILNSFADDLSLRAIITDTDFMKSSIQVAKSTVNPDRLETSFRYKRSGYARIASTTAEANFDFGTRQ